MDDGAIRKALREQSEEFRRLEELHSKLDRKLVELLSRSDVRPEDEIEEKRLKKMKLKVKDEMYRMMVQYTARIKEQSQQAGKGGEQA